MIGIQKLRELVDRLSELCRGNDCSENTKTQTERF